MFQNPLSEEDIDSIETYGSTDEWAGMRVWTPSDDSDHELAPEYGPGRPIVVIRADMAMAHQKMEQNSALYRGILERMERIEKMMAEQTEIVKKIAEQLTILTNTGHTGHEDQDTEDMLDVEDEQAREMIIEYMREHQEAWPQDISRDLRLDFAQVMRITRTLVSEGVLRADGPE